MAQQHDLTPDQVHRRVVDAYEEVRAGRLDEALALIDPEVIDHRGGTDGDHEGIDAWRAKWEGFADLPLTDVGVTIEQNVTAGDTSVHRYTSRGTDPRTGRSFAVTSIDMVRVRDGRIYEHWALQDQAARAAQLAAPEG